MLLQSLSELQQQGPLRISHGQEDRINGAYGSRSPGRHRRSDRGYLPNEFKKEKPSTFDGDVKKSEDVEAWILGMNKFFELDEYTYDMKARISIFNLKGKADIWWQDVKQVRDIRTNDLNWWQLKRLFRKKYLSKRYYDNKAKEFYELKMGSMIDEEYTTKFLELLRYVPYLTDEKAKFQ
eukprot:PITA_32219